MPDGRPDPAVLLDRAQRDERRVGRGRLKVFFGAAPGVGKTYAMLAAAQRLARDGVDVVVGLVETHGRIETERQVLGLDMLPRREAAYRGADDAAAPITLSEFDLDVALTRRPEILLLDELAHTNAPGSRFEKRWQDVQELLRGGISVYTTLNVQHLESLHDVVAQITGIRVREAVPDAVVEEADEIELVDLPPEVLLERLRAGKVYLPESARAATDEAGGFFRPGNLTALRELALRRTAAWVEAQMRRYKDGHGIRAVWPAAERILVAVSPSPASSRIVRAAKRMAAGLHADLIAAYVETPRAARRPQSDRDRALQTLRLAERLGAETVTLSGPDAAAELVALARARNIGRIVVGKTARSRLAEAVLGSFVNNLIRCCGEIEVCVIRGDGDRPDTRAPESAAGPRARSGPRAYAGALGLVLLCTAGGLAFAPRVELSNITMVYLAGVVVSAAWLGRGPAVLAAVVGVAAFNFCFVPPRWTFAVSNAQYLVTFMVMLAVGLLIASLTTRLRELAVAARARERRTAALFAASRALAAARDRREVATAAARHVRETFDTDAAILVGGEPDRGEGLEVLASAGAPEWLDASSESGRHELGVARWALDHATPAGRGTPALGGAAGRYLPLAASQGRAGVLAMRPTGPLDTAQLLMLDTLTNQIALALERVTLIESRQAARIEAESERLRGALLSSVSHDLRTPLASIAGAAEALRDAGSLDGATRAELTESIVHEAGRLNDLIANLVFATRLEAGGIDLRREWNTMEEIVGAGLRRLRGELAQRPSTVRIPADLPLVRVDGAMLPQVIHNLVENALRYTTPGTPLEVAAWATDTSVVLRVADEGPGLADGERTRVFERFYRGRAARPAGTPPGLGLGLAICEGVIRAHGGRIWVEPNVPRGVAFQFSLPIERPQPTVPRDTAEGL